MYMMYYLDESGKRVYTLKKLDPYGRPTISAHPARFSPEDQYAKQRITIKKRFHLLLTQKPKSESCGVKEEYRVKKEPVYGI